MNLGHDLVSYANRILVSNLTSLSETVDTRYNDQNTGNIEDFELFVRGATQLVEICSWIGIIQSVQKDLEKVMSFLQTISTKEKKFVKTHPSRLKSLLLFGKYDEESLSEALNQICADRSIYCDDKFSVQHLSYVDLLGLYLNLEKNKKLPSKLIDKKLSRKIRTILNYESKLILELLHDKSKLTSLAVRSLSFLAWIVLVNKFIESDASIKKQLRTIQKIVQKRMSYHSEKDHLAKYEDWIFTEVAYAYMTLFWFQRHWHWPIKDDPKYLQWMLACAEELRTLHNPYHACLFIKQVI